jgi:hypothetical protein
MEIVAPRPQKRETESTDFIETLPFLKSPEINYILKYYKDYNKGKENKNYLDLFVLIWTPKFVLPRGTHDFRSSPGLRS